MPTLEKIPLLEKYLNTRIGPSAHRNTKNYSIVINPVIKSHYIRGVDIDIFGSETKKMKSSPDKILDSGLM